MIFDIEDISYSGVTRVVFGQPKSFDVSVIFENNETDAFTSIPITEHELDDDAVFYIDEIGYTTRDTLLSLGFSKLECDYLFRTISIGDFS